MKNPFDHMSARSIRIVYTIFALAVLAICAERFLTVMVFRVTSNDQCAWMPLGPERSELLIEGVVPGGVTDQAGIRNGDTLLTINGIHFKTAAQAQAIIDSLKSGDSTIYKVKRGETTLETRVHMLKVFDVRFLAVFLLGFGFLVVGYVVVMTKPHGRIQRKFGRYGIFAMLLFGMVAVGINPAQEESWKLIFLIAGILVGRFFAPPLFISFFFNFPVRKKILNHRWVVPLLYVFNGALLLPIFFRDWFPFLNTTAYMLLVNVPIFFFMAGLGVFAHSYFKLVDIRRRRHLRPILAGVAIGIITFTYFGIVMNVNPFAIYLDPIILTPALLIILVPQMFGYAIFRYRLMDIDLLVKRGLIYGVLTTSLAAIYIVFVFGIGSLLGKIVGQSENRILSIIALVVIAFAFDPLKRRVQEYIDRTFYRERRNYQKALLEFSQELPRQMNLNQILNSMVNRISGTMHVEKVAVVLCDAQEGCDCVTRNIPGEYCKFVGDHAGLIDLLQRTKTPQSFSLLAEEPDSVTLEETDKAKILISGVVLAVPMMLKDRLIGTINVGPKMSGKVYSQDDIDLLSTVASQAAIAIENARLHASEIEKQKIEEELALARRIQQGLLPKSSPVINGLDIDGISIPALSVGGDYFDYIQLSPTKLLVVVADVSGKGMSASLYMSKVQGMVQLASRMYTSPRDILVHVNRLLFDGMERKSFITMILALFDLERREVRICRAGHNKALIQTNGSIASLQSRGIGLGLERGPLFESELEEVRHSLKHGGVYVFYTDGLTEAMNEKREEFGEAAVTQLVERHDGKTACDIRELLVSAVKKFQGTAEQHDDLTLVVVKAS